MLNADIYISTGQGLVGTNMFAYCYNNPTLLQDDTGRRPDVNGGMGRETKEEFQQSIAAMKIKIDPNSNFDDVQGKMPKDSLRPSSAKDTERRQTNDAWGKRGTKKREGMSKDLHDSKKGKRNDDNVPFEDLLSPIIAQISVLAGAGAVAFLIADNLTVVGSADDTMIPEVIAFIERNLPNCWQIA